MTIQSEVTRRAHTDAHGRGRQRDSATPAPTSASIRNTRGSSFSLCERSRTDPAYPRYPRLPVLECAGLGADDGRQAAGSGRGGAVSARAARIGAPLRWGSLAAGVVFAATRDGDGERRPRAAPTRGARWPRARSSAPRSARRGSATASTSSAASSPAAARTGRMARYDISEDRWREVASAADRRQPSRGHRPRRQGLRLRRQPARRRRAESASPIASTATTPARDRWTRLPDAPTARAAMGFVGIGDRLYAAGGYTRDQLRRASARDLRRRARALAPRPEDADRPQPRRRRRARRRDGRHRRPARARSTAA